MKKRRIVSSSLKWMALVAVSFQIQVHAAEQPHNDQLVGIYEYIENSEYDIRQVADQGVLKAANRAQNLRFTLGADGFAIASRLR